MSEQMSVNRELFNEVMVPNYAPSAVIPVKGDYIVIPCTEQLHCDSFYRTLEPCHSVYRELHCDSFYRGLHCDLFTKDLALGLTLPILLQRIALQFLLYKVTCDAFYRTLGLCHSVYGELHCDSLCRILHCDFLSITLRFLLQRIAW